MMLEVAEKYQKVFERMEVDDRGLRYTLFEEGGERGLDHLTIMIRCMSSILGTTF